MGSIAGKIESCGPIVEVTVMATPFRVAILKAQGQPVPAPATIRALIDTGASASVLDATIILRLGLTSTGSALVHTPSTGEAYKEMNQFDVSLILGHPHPDPAHFTIGVFESHLASEGFCVLIGWDVLSHCRLFCDGPAHTFRIEF